MQLHVAHLRRVHARVLARLPQHRCLGLGAGHGEAFGGAVVVDCAAEDDAVDRVPVAHRVCQGLQDDDPAAFAAHVAVGPRIEGEAASVGRQPAEPPGDLGAFGREVERHAARQGQAGLALAQALQRQVDRDQRRRLRGVDHEAGAAQAQRVRHPVRDDAAVEPRQRVLRDGAAALRQRRVVAGYRADEDGRRRAAERLGDDSRVLQSFPGQFGEQPLLRVDRHGLARRDPEERRVESVDLVEEPAVTQPGPMCLRHVGQDLAGIPTVRRHFGDRAAPGAQQRPEGTGVGRLREATRHTDDGDGISILATITRHAGECLPHRALRERLGRAVSSEARSSAPSAVPSYP